jgi:hypothetical protein
MKTFNNLFEFHQALFSMGKLSSFNQGISDFLNLVGGLSGGCGCSKAKRTEAARLLYIKMPHILTLENKEEIKQKLSVEKVSLADGGGVFCVF